MRRAVEGAPLLALALLVALSALGSAARQARTLLWERYAAYTSPFLETWPAGAARPPRTQRIVIVVVHGLRLAESRRMPTLNALRQRGADVTIELTPPAYDLPATLTWLSGARPEVHGATTNQSPLLTRPDTVLRAAQAAGWLVTFVGSEQRHDWLGGAQRAMFTDDLNPAQRDQQAIALATEALGAPLLGQPQLIVLSLDLVAQVARQDPDSYSAAVAATDFRIQGLLAQMNLEAETLVVLSERGIASGGYDGGGEAEVVRVPLVMAGAGVLPGSVAVAPAVAIAPTLAVLTGAPFPIHAQSGFIHNVLAAEPAAFIASAQQLTTFYDQWSATIGQPRFAADLLRRYSERLAAGDPLAYVIWQAELSRAAEKTAGAQLTAERITRLPLVLGLGLLLIVLAGSLLNNWISGPLAGALGYAVAWVVTFFVIYRAPLSLSLFPEGNPEQAFTTWEHLSAVLLGVASALVAAGTGKRSDVLEAVAVVLSALGVIAIALAAIALAFYWQWGDVFLWTLPDATWFVVALLVLTQLSAFMVQISPTLPALPLPLLVAAASALIYAGVRRSL
jgi:hypothetical protein